MKILVFSFKRSPSHTLDTEYQLACNRKNDLLTNKTKSPFICNFSCFLFSVIYFNLLFFMRSAVLKRFSVWSVIAFPNRKDFFAL